MNENNLVTKANVLITAHYSTSLEELRIIRALISLIQPHDEDFKPYTFYIAEFINLLGTQDQSKYTKVPKITESLMKKIIKIREGKRLIQVAWLSSAVHDFGSGTVTLKFDPELKPYLLGLKKLFITYQLKNVLILTSKYSIRLYEILKANEYKKTVVISLDELMEIFLLGKTYSDFYNLKKRIIEPAQKELAEKTDIMFEFETITARKRVTALKFIIQPNPKNKSQKPLQEPPRQLPENNTNTLPPDSNNKQLALPEPTKEDIETIKIEFKRRYKGGLVDKFVKEMIERKGLAHVQQCLRTYQDYIKGQDIKNVGGHFKYFVMEGYEKPVQHKGGNSGNKPLKDNFEQRKYTREQCEKWENAALLDDLDESKPESKEKNSYTYIEEEEENESTIPYIERKGYI